MSFLKSTLIILFLVSLLAGPASAQQTEKAKVFYAMETSSLAQRRTPNPAVVRRMVDNLVCAATGKPNPAAAWASLVKASDRIGIKVAASGGAVSGTHPAVVKAIATGLISAGVQPSNIIVWDRNLDDLLAAGYSRNDQLYRLRWVDTATGYDKKSQVTAPVIGRLIWGDSAFGDRTGSRMEDMLGGGEQLSSTSYYAKVLSQEVDKVINVPSLTDSFLTGVNGALANMTLPNLDNWRRFTRSPDFGDPYLAEIYADAMIHGKVVLTISSSVITGTVLGAPEYLSRLSMILGGFSGVFAVLAMVSIMALLTSGALSLVLRYLRWNLKFIQEGK